MGAGARGLGPVFITFPGHRKRAKLEVEQLGPECTSVKIERMNYYNVPHMDKLHNHYPKGRKLGWGEQPPKHI